MYHKRHHEKARQAASPERMDRSMYNGATCSLPSDVETDADPVPGSFMSEDRVTSVPVQEKTESPNTILDRKEEREEMEHNYYSNPQPLSAQAVPFGCSREGGQHMSSPGLHPAYGQSGAHPCLDARAPVQISSPSGEQESSPVWEPRNVSSQVAPVKGQHWPSSFLPKEEEGNEREKSKSLPYSSEVKGYDSGPDLEEEEEEEDVEHYDFFLVYSEKDKKHARKIMDLLKSYKLKGCLLEKDFPAGVSPFKNIEEAINRSTYTVLVLTENFTQDRWCEKKHQTSLFEAIENLDRYNSVIPIIPHPDLMPKKKIPSELRTVSQLDMTNDYFESKIKKTFSTKKRREREKNEKMLKRKQQSRASQLPRSVYSVPTDLSSQKGFESLSAEKSSQSLGKLNNTPGSNGERNGKEEKSRRSVGTKHTPSDVQRMRPSKGGQLIHSQKDAGFHSTNGKNGSRMGKSAEATSPSMMVGLAHNQANNRAASKSPLLDSTSSRQTLHTQQSTAGQPQRAVQSHFRDSCTLQEPNQLQKQDASITTKTEPHWQAMNTSADQVEAGAEVGGFVWVERCDSQSTNPSSLGISVTPGSSDSTIHMHVKSQEGSDFKKHASKPLKENKEEVPTSSQQQTGTTTTRDSKLKMQDARPSDDKIPTETYTLGAGDGQPPAVGNIPMIPCQPPVLPQPYQVTNVYNIYSPKHIQIGNQNAMEKDYVVTDGPDAEQPVYYVPPVPYPPNMGATPNVNAANPQVQGQKKTSDNAAGKMNEEYDVDDETDVKVPVEPEFDLDDETQVKVPVKSRMQPTQLVPPEIARSESCSSADEAQEETWRSVVADHMAEDLNLNTNNESTSVKELQNLQTVDEDSLGSMISHESIPKQKKGSNFLSFLSRGKKK